METLSSKSQKLLLTRDFLKYLLTSNTGCIAYKSYTSAAKCNSLTQLHSITSGKKNKIGMEESSSYLYFCGHFNPLIILLVKRNHFCVR
ncbi:hypothetical protein NC652_017450 [Populus alba x Populus x berolinensis]|nr:hypothetical protein NC652_017450 [Populus alba x Populus x berolinensis]